MPEKLHVNKKFHLLSVISILCLIFLLSTSYSAGQYRKNFDILDSLIKSRTDKISSEVTDKDLKKLYIEIQNHPALWLLKQDMIESLRKSNIETYDKKIENEPMLVINIKKAEIIFINSENSNDSLNRHVKVELSSNIVFPDGRTEPISNDLSEYTDVISRENVELIKSDYEFANAPVPEKPKTFFEEVAEPIIVVTTAIITVVLLFTIRSS